MLHAGSGGQELGSPSSLHSPSPSKRSSPPRAIDKIAASPAPHEREEGIPRRLRPPATLSRSRELGTGLSAVDGPNRVGVEEYAGIDDAEEQLLVSFSQEVSEALTAAASSEDRQRSPPPQYPASEASSSSFRPAPPPFSSLFAPSSSAHPGPAEVLEPCKLAAAAVVAATLSPAASPSASSTLSAAPAYIPSGSPTSSHPSPSIQEETKRALPRDTKREGESSRSKDDEAEPPPAYSEGSSPLQSFTYLMAAAGGAASIITQVQQGGPPINAIGDVGVDETITMDLR